MEDNTIKEDKVIENLGGEPDWVESSKGASSPLGGSQQSQLMAISLGPSFNYTSHKKDSVAGYTLIQTMDNATNTALHTLFNGQPAYLLAQTTQPTCQGDEGGVGGGVKSGTVGKEVKPTSGAGTIIVEGKQLVREGDTCTMNNENTTGTYISTVNFNKILKEHKLAQEQQPELWAGPTGDSALTDLQQQRYLESINNNVMNGAGSQRGLHASEAALVKEIFGDSIDTSKVVLHNEPLFGERQGPTTAVTTGDDIYFGKDVYSSNYAMDKPKQRKLFIHEMTHVWQHQNGQALITRGIFTQIKHRGLGIESYEYELDRSKDIYDYNLEQQASIVADYYALKKSYSLRPRSTNADRPSLSDYEAFLGDVLK